MKPEYEIAATKLKEHDIKIANVDCTVEKDVCAGQGVQGYPSVKVFRNGVSSEFKGARTADSIVEVMIK
jgi:protein disulfide-isomerase A1